MHNKRVLLNMRYIKRVEQFERPYASGKEWEYTFLLVDGTFETFKTRDQEDVDYIECLINDCIPDRLELPPPPSGDDNVSPPVCVQCGSHTSVAICGISYYCQVCRDINERARINNENVMRYMYKFPL